MEGILTDKMIRASIDDGSIVIDPFNPDHVNPASVDLTLGDEVTIYTQWVGYDDGYDKRSPHGISRADASGKPRDGSDFYPINSLLDVKREPETVSFKIDPTRGWVLRPGIGYLMHTRERVCTKKYNPILDGKSSIGRLFLQVHATAGFGDVNFDGQYTLEVTAVHPVRVYPGMRFCQIRFHTLHGEVEHDYSETGHYKGAEARGARPSQAWKQFR